MPWTSVGAGEAVEGRTVGALGPATAATEGGMAGSLRPAAAAALGVEVSTGEGEVLITRGQ